MWLRPSSEEHRNARLSSACVNPYQAPFLSHPRNSFKKNTAINTFLHDDNLQVLIHDCHKRKDETRFVRAAVLTLSRKIWPQDMYLRLEQNSLIWPRLSDGVKKAQHHIHRPWPYESSYLASSMDCCLLLLSCWPGCPTNSPKISGVYWYSDDTPQPSAAWDSMVEKKWTAQTHR